MENLFKKIPFIRPRESWLGVLLDHPISNDERCQGCDGFCCRSFPTVNITWNEFETLKALGARRLHFSLNGHHKLIIEDGCEFQFQGKCSIYRHRPVICRRFICQKKMASQTSTVLFPSPAELHSN
ncbi:MAG: zinc/iron-chelating domain-containing protein [Desulfobacca sp.]|nr:zinc/iron-chelating domain-containing protein [Desulfobacca sp.]